MTTPDLAQMQIHHMQSQRRRPQSVDLSAMTAQTMHKQSPHSGQSSGSQFLPTWQAQVVPQTPQKQNAQYLPMTPVSIHHSTCEQIRMVAPSPQQPQPQMRTFIPVKQSQPVPMVPHGMNGFPSEMMNKRAPHTHPALSIVTNARFPIESLALNNPSLNPPLPHVDRAGLGITTTNNSPTSMEYEALIRNMLVEAPDSQQYERQSTSSSEPETPRKRKAPMKTASIAMLVPDILSNAIHVDTKVTEGDIASHIKHNKDTGKLECLWENCGKVFARKENAKAHVQTHLEDRQLKCPDCGKTFVRQHDFQRHYIIHTGVKPYACICGKSFSRADALTRHQIRNNCTGDPSTPHREVKRGRPRKIVPATPEERHEKKVKMRARHVKTVSDVSMMSVQSMVSTQSWIENGRYMTNIPQNYAPATAIFSAVPTQTQVHMAKIAEHGITPTMTLLKGNDLTDLSNFRLTPPMSPETESTPAQLTSQIETHSRQSHASPPPSRHSENNTGTFSFEDFQDSVASSPPELDMSSTSPSPLFKNDLMVPSLDLMSFPSLDMTLMDAFGEYPATWEKLEQQMSGPFGLGYETFNFDTVL